MGDELSRRAQPVAQAECCWSCEGAGTAGILGDDRPDRYVNERPCKDCNGTGAAQPPAEPAEPVQEVLRLFVGASYPVDKRINKRGYNWCEAYLDQALAAARALVVADAPAIARTDGMPTSSDERYLRRLLAHRVSVGHAYYDDREAHGNEHGISIDFMREPVADIDAKLRALNVARFERIAPAAAPSVAPEPPEPSGSHEMLAQTISALAAIDRALGMPEDGCNSTQRTLNAIELMKCAIRDDAAEIERLRTNPSSVAPESATDAEPVAWVNGANLKSESISRQRNAGHDTHTWSSCRTDYHDTPLRLAAHPPRPEPLIKPDDLFVCGQMGANITGVYAQPEPAAPAVDDADLTLVYMTGYSAGKADALDHARRLNKHDRNQADVAPSVAPEPVEMRPYNPTEAMRWAAKRVDPALPHEHIRSLWCVMWSAYAHPPERR